MRARHQPEQASIPTPTPIQTMIGRIGNHCLEATPEGARLFGRVLAGSQAAGGAGHELRKKTCVFEVTVFWETVKQVWSLSPPGIRGAGQFTTCARHQHSLFS